MDVIIRNMDEKDIPSIVNAWNSYFIFDPVDESIFSRKVIGDPNFEPSSCLVALKENHVMGFICVVARDTVKGRDGKGTFQEKFFGYIKALFSVKNPQQDEIMHGLLQEGLGYLKSRKKKIAFVGDYTGDYFFPGIDERYGDLVAFFSVAGFKKFDFEEDVSIDLVSADLSSRLSVLLKKMEEIGVVLQSFNRGDLDRMRLFVEILDYVQWFPHGWEMEFGRGGTTIVAKKGDEIIGWAEYNPDTSEFGPIAVLPSFREMQIGSALLMESLNRLKNLGATNISAGWANTPFYTVNGWHVARTYIVFQKKI